MGTLKDSLDALQHERAKTHAELGRIERAIAALTKLVSPNGAGRAFGVRAPRARRKISAAGRRRIAAAQRARWAKIRAAQKKKA